MTQEELTNSKEYKIYTVAVDWYQENTDADAIDGFEAGYKKAREDVIEKAVTWLKHFAFTYARYDIFQRRCVMRNEFIEDFKRELKKDNNENI